MSMSSRSVPLLGPLVAAALLAACQDMTPSVCTQVGAESGVVFEYANIVPDAPGASLTVRACVEAACKSQEVGLNQGAYNLVGGREALRRGDGKLVEVRLTVHDGRGRAVFAGGTTVTPTKLQPNGSSCPPTAWVGRVTARGEGQLVVRPTR